jgi:hypothetical protein
MIIASNEVTHYFISAILLVVMMSPPPRVVSAPGDLIASKRRKSIHYDKCCPILYVLVQIIMIVLTDL